VRRQARGDPRGALLRPFAFLLAKGMKASSQCERTASICRTAERLLHAMVCSTQWYTPAVMQVFVILRCGTRYAYGGAAAQAVSHPRRLAILIHSLRAFASVERVTAIYVAVRDTEMERVRPRLRVRLDAKVKVVEGGDNRQESVSNALAVLPAHPEDIVLVHDAVRPLIDAATIDRTIDAVELHGAAIVGLPAVDTIKQVERTAHGALIVSTIPREFVVLAQTPQGFRFKLLQQAFAEATADGFVGTDEARWWSAPDTRSPWCMALRLI